MPRSGELTQFITIQKRGNSTTGELGDNQSPFCTVWEDVPAKILQLTGRQAEFEHMILPTASHTVECRYLEGVQEGQIIKWGCRTLGIGNVSYGDGKEQNGKKFWLKLLCSEDKTKVQTE